MLSPVTIRVKEELGRCLTKKSFFRESKNDSELARLSTYGAQEKVKSNDFSDEKVKVMLLAAEVMLLHAEVMLLHVGDFVGEHEKKRGDTWCAAPALRVI